ncbi:MAG: peptidase domain-containing ABC transporter [Lewinellaceae bacterium]|nr:peptidase domain-containing ABC transporter [Saprospiraceae bacterium]MCB9329701.1 peptidase domain-containing ABC transporter [Lewinellaceae bacterium]
MLADSFPFYKQLDASDCGATCLRIVARYHGRHYSLDYLRDLSYLDREGVSLMGIADAAEKIGFRTLGVKTGFGRLQAELPLPCIAHWKQNHFLVVYRIANGKVYVSDPAVGKVQLTEQEFLDNWISDVYNTEPQGILLLLETSPEFFQREGETTDRAGLGILGRYLVPHKRLIWQLMLGLILGSAVQLVFPFLMQALVDKGVQLNDLSFVYLILAAQGMLFLSQVAVEFIRGWILLHIGTRVNINLVSDFLIKLMRLPMAFFDSKMTGDLLQRIYDNERVERFLTSNSLVTLFSVVSLLVFGLVLLFYNVWIFAIFFIAALFYFGWVALFMHRRRALDYRRFEQMADNQNALIQLVNGMQEIKLHNAERQKRWAWERIQAKLFRVNVDYLATDQMQRAGAAFINEGKNILISVTAATAVIHGDMTLGMMLAVQYIIGHMNGPLESLVQFILVAQEAKISLERMNEIHLKPDEEPVDDAKVTVLPANGDLIMEDLSFRYGGPHEPWVLRNIKLNFPEGKVTAIVGSSGSGKTTLVKLLLNFYPPTEGSVRLGDINLANIDHKLWRSHCGVVLQDGFIFSDTIARNITLGEDNIDRRKLLYAAKVANIQTFIESLPLGYNTKIGQDGVGVSQGQRQRILIARAVYKNPDYIFFDEATNALDAYNERVIMHNLENVFRNKTVIIVAHRLSTVRNADNIIVLEKGEVVEQGTHDELTYNRGAYYHLVKNQLELGM